MSVTAPPPPVSRSEPRPDWRLEIPESRRRLLRAWLWSIAGMTFLTLVVGGITRLTQSGLSIVDWQPLIGVVPPLNEVQWQEAFDRYRAFPEYQRLRQGMSLSEFKFIFFWEYLHRMVARTIGLVFLVPFLVFLAKGFMNRPLRNRALLLFGLGASQGLMGWFMVTSGLVDQPRVSHYRLAAHLSLAFLIFGYAVWLARDLAVRADPPRVPRMRGTRLLRGVVALGVLMGVQIVWGAFVAGLKAGLYYNTFPLMAGSLLPPDFLLLAPGLVNLVENPSAVQWIHRLLGTLLLVGAIAFALRLRGPEVDPTFRRLAGVFAGLVAFQYLLGVATLLLMVPVSLGVAHQGMAMILAGVWVAWLHHTREARAGQARGRH
jgi:heme a synthase